MMQWLVYLLCPLMMLPMMFFMMKGNPSRDHGALKKGSDEVEELKQQNEKLQKELQELKNSI